jgi:DNA-binding HxlR family transcriptional regulator
MTTDPQSERRAPGFTVEVRGEFSKADLHQAIDRLGAGEIRSFQLEIRTAEPLAAAVPGFEPGDTNEDQSLPTQAETQGNPPETAPADAAREADDGDATATADTTQSPRLQQDSGAYNVARLLDDADEWLRTTEIKDQIPDDWDISDDTVGSTLWQLTDRSLVEKRPYEADNRQTEYQITDTGRDAIERVSSTDPPGSERQGSDAQA